VALSRLDVEIDDSEPAAKAPGPGTDVAEAGIAEVGADGLGTADEPAALGEPVGWAGAVPPADDPRGVRPPRGESVRFGPVVVQSVTFGPVRSEKCGDSERGAAGPPAFRWPPLALGAAEVGASS
jgi:hypothetical protein